MKILIIILTAIVLNILMAVPVMLLWNYLSGDVIPLEKINLWQSVALVFLCHILFKNDKSSDK